MRLTLSVALSLALIAAPASAQGPCDVLAAAIDARFAAGTPVATVGRALVLEEFPGATIPPRARVDIRLDGVDFRAEDGATRAAVPHAAGVRFVEMREGSARCQLFALYRMQDGRARLLGKPGIGGEGELCWPDTVRPLGVSGRGFVARIDVYDARVDLHPVTRAGAARGPECRVVLETRLDGRIEALEPNDAASVQARRAAMAELEPMLPEMARAMRTGAPWHYLDGQRDRERDLARWVAEFNAGGGRYVAALSDAPGGISVRLARLFPELGNRERPLGGFVYAGEPRFVRALSRAPELR